MKSLMCGMLAFFMLTLMGACGSGGNGSVVSCGNPAPLNGQPNPMAPNYIVFYQEGVDAVSETQRLATLYQFEPTHVYDSLGGFSAPFTPDQLGHIRCEPTVASVHYDQVSVPLGDEVQVP